MIIYITIWDSIWTSITEKNKNQNNLNLKMEEIKELKEKINKLDIVVNILNQKFEDHFLTDEEKELIDEAIKEKKEGKLVDISNIN